MWYKHNQEEIVHSRCLILKANMGDNNDSANPTFWNDGILYNRNNH